MPKKPVTFDNNLNELLKDIEKKYGEGSVIKLDNDKKLNIDTISTGSISIDYALGVGGIPQGRIIELYGAASSGKSTLALHVISQAQKKNINCAYIDAEHSFDSEYAKLLGVDISKIILSQPETGEQAFDVSEALIKSDKVKLIIVDSVASLIPKSELEAEIGASQIGALARLMSISLKKIALFCAKYNATMIFINQTRMQINAFGFGNPTTTSGGMALKFYSSVRVEVNKTAKIKKSDEIVGHRIKVNIAKNKVASPFKTTEVDFLFGRGISAEADLINFCLTHSVMTKEGNSIHYNGKSLGRSLDSAREYLETNKEEMSEIEKEVRKMFNI